MFVLWCSESYQDIFVVINCFVEGFVCEYLNVVWYFKFFFGFDICFFCNEGG